MSRCVWLLLKIVLGAFQKVGQFVPIRFSDQRFVLVVVNLRPGGIPSLAAALVVEVRQVAPDNRVDEPELEVVCGRDPPPPFIA